ncbi:MAG: hypothetical protein J0L84_02855 [Verrucomicrobia bacterium]|nr:hypothetical protein [Verrucomicrobiota bacterium]
MKFMFAHGEGLVPLIGGGLISIMIFIGGFVVWAFGTRQRTRRIGVYLMLFGMSFLLAGMLLMMFGGQVMEWFSGF